MARNLTSLNVSLTATTGPFATALKSAETAAISFGNRLKSAILSPIGLISAALSGAAITAGIERAAERIDQLAKSADRLGISTQSLAGLEHAANLANVSAEQLATSMEKLTKKVQEAADGNKEAAKSIHDLGLRYSDLAAMRPDAQFAAVTDAINKLDTQGKKTVATLDLFGKSGGALLPLLQGGSKGLKDATEEAKAFGLALSRVDAAKVEEANDAMTKVGAVMKGIFNQIAVKVAPLVTALATAFTESAKEANGFGSAIDSVMRGVVNAVQYLAGVWIGMRIRWKEAEIQSMEISQSIVDLGNTAVEVFQWIGAKALAAWDLIEAGSRVMDHSLAVTWAAMKVPVAYFVEFVGQQLSAMLRQAGEAASRFDDELGVSLQSAADRVALATGTVVADSKKALKENTAALQVAAAETADATAALFAPVVTDGSAALSELSNQYAAQANMLNGQLADLYAKQRAMESAPDIATTVENDAEARAVVAAKQITDAQEQQDAISKINAEGLRRREDERSRWQAITETSQWKYTQQTVTGMSSMFANLATLQNTHSKKAQQIGKAAAKAKIVMDTASAAMGAYSAMASIPYVGPVLGIAAAAAAVAAGAIQLANVDKSDSGSMGGGPTDTSTTNLGGVQAPAGQTLVLQGDSFSADSLVKLFNEAKERGLVIDAVRHG